MIKQGRQITLLECNFALSLAFICTYNLQKLRPTFLFTLHIAYLQFTSLFLSVKDERS